MKKIISWLLYQHLKWKIAKSKKAILSGKAKKYNTVEEILNKVKQ